MGQGMGWGLGRVLPICLPLFLSLCVSDLFDLFLFVSPCLSPYASLVSVFLSQSLLSVEHKQDQGLPPGSGELN